MPLSKTDDILLSMSAESLKRLYEMAERAMDHIKSNPRPKMKQPILVKAILMDIFNDTVNPIDEGFIKQKLGDERPEDVMDAACEVAKTRFPNTTADVSLGDRFLSTERNHQTGMQEWFGTPPDMPGTYAAMDNCGYFEKFDCPYDMLCKAAAYYRA